MRLCCILFPQTCKDTTDIGALQKAADFVRAFTLGFEVDVSNSIIHYCLPDASAL